LRSNRQRFHLRHLRDFDHLYEMIKSAYKEGLTPEAVCDFLKKTRGFTAEAFTLKSRIKSWRLHQKSDLGPYFSEIKSASDHGVIPSDALKVLNVKYGVSINAKALREQI